MSEPLLEVQDAIERQERASAAEFFATPARCTLGILQALRTHFALKNFRAGRLRCLEPTAGEGAIIRAVQSVYPSDWTAVEIRSECEGALRSLGADVEIGDFRDIVPGLARVDLAIGNPPFSLALAVVRACLEVADTTAMLLRLNWLESAEREPWLRAHTPDVYVLPDRPSFSGGGSDNCAYAWMVWHGRGERVQGRIEVLPLLSGQASLFASRGQ